MVYGLSGGALCAIQGRFRGRIPEAGLSYLPLELTVTV